MGLADFGRVFSLPSPHPWHLLFCSVLVVGLAGLTGCSDYPKDTRGTLDNIRESGVLRIGVIENPPWVIRGEEGPEGLEPSIVRSLAEKLNVEVRWHWGSTGVVIQALEQHELDLVIGGLTTGPRLPKTVAATKPYFTTRYTIGFRTPVDATPLNLDGEPVAVAVLSPLHQVLKDKGADPRPMQSPWQSPLTVAGPLWELRARGYIPSQRELMTEKQVMVAAKGENAWILLLQRHLNELEGLDEQLVRAGETE